MRFGRLSALLGAVAAALGLALCIPAGTADAMEAPSQTVTAVTPGTSTTAGTPLVPSSILTTTPGVSGGVSDLLPGLLWSGGADVQQSMMLNAFDQMTSPGGTKVTNTGHGNLGNYWCTEAFSIGAGSWGADVPRNVDVERGNKYPTAGTAFPTECGQSVENVICYNAGSASNLFQSVPVPSYAEVGGGLSSTIVNACAKAVTTNSVPVEWVIAPTAANGTATGTIATDGGTFVNPDYETVVGSNFVITTAKTCKNIATGATTIVQADGPPGSGVVPNVVCPAGTYPVSQTITAHLPGLSSYGQVLSTTSLGTTALSLYPNCVQGTILCDLSVWIDGIRCAYLVSDCGTWADIQQTQPDRISCHWGGYVLPSVNDCNELQNCYGVPIDSISSPVSGDPTQCGINPGGTSGEPLEPLQAGKFKCTSGCPVDPSPSAGPTGPTGPAGTDGTDGTDGKDGTTPTVVVSPTIVVNVPQPTVNVTVNAPGPGDVDVPDGDCSPMYPTGKAKFNPMDWGYKPTRCALEKLFVPAPGHLAELQGEAGNGVTDAFGTWTTPITNIAGAFNVSASTGCMGPPVNLGFPFNKTIYPANACSEPAASIAAVCRLGCQAGLLIGGFSAGAFSILQGFGINFRTFTVRSEVAARMAEKDAKKSG